MTWRNVETASIKAAVTVGVNARITSGKERGIINASWNVRKYVSLKLNKSLKLVVVHFLPLFQVEDFLKRTSLLIIKGTLSSAFHRHNFSLNPL